MTKRAVIYARVSTDEQAEKGYSLPSQIEAMRKYAADHGMEIAAEFIEDYTGAKLDRPQLDRTRAMLDQGEANVVIVHTADRLSRNLAHSILLREEWQRAGIELHTVARGKSEDTAESRLTDNIEAVIAEFEREKIKERSRRGRLTKAKSGKWPGHTPPPYGYKRNGRGKEICMAIDEPRALIVQRIFRMYLGDLDHPPVRLVELHGS